MTLPPPCSYNERDILGDVSASSFYSDAHGSSTGAAAGLPSFSASRCKPSLTRRQLDCMRYIQGYIEAHKESPTYEQIASGIGSKSKSVTFRFVRALKERGFIKIRGKKNYRRTIKILRPVVLPRIGQEPLQFISLEEITWTI